MTENDFAALQGHAFIALTTYRKSGEGVVTPVWFVQNDGKLYVTTSDTSGKVKRLRRNPQVKLAPSDFSGKPLGPQINGSVHFPSKAEWEALRDLFLAKYGMQFRFFSYTWRLRGQNSNIYLEISPSTGEPSNKQGKTDNKENFNE